MAHGGDDFANAAFKRLEKTRRSGSGWGPDHYARLFGGFGFGAREGKKHTIYFEPGHPDNCVMIPRHRELKPYSAIEAVRAIDAMLERRKGQT